MKCPHFQKVNFQRIKQVRNEQAPFQQQSNQYMNNSIFSIQSISQEIYNVPEEGIDQINNFKTNSSHHHKHFFNRIQNNKEDAIKQSSKIKMPKQMNIKKMITSSQIIQQPSFRKHSIRKIQSRYVSNYSQQNSQQIQNQGQIPSQHQNYNYRKNPHILISRTTMMTHQTFQVFNGIVFLCSKQQNPYQCELKDYIIKIEKQDKIKYFIQLQKVKVSLQKIDDNCRAIGIKFKCKNKNGQIRLFFITEFQKDIFKEVYTNCLSKIQITRKLKKAFQHDKQNYLSNTSYNFGSNKNNNIASQQFQEQQSLILDEQNQLADQNSPQNIKQLSQSISSLSMNSYQGDSLVFETQRLFFQNVKQTGNTFDILLFKNKSLMSKFQRIFTNSDYDHTAMLLRTANNQLLMLQATSNSGVAIYTFSSLLKIDKDKYFSRIGLRRYKGQKNYTKISRLQNFIRKTVGKKYKFDPMYLIKSSANQQKETFFCSQLVAQALQEVGILSNQWPSFKYLPKHFAQQNLNSKIIDGKFGDTIILE